jgi:hypothetical protein
VIARATAEAPMAIRRTMSITLPCAVIALACGCAAGDTDSSPVRSFSQMDSAGVTIHVTPEVEAFAPLGWEVDTVPEFALGADDSSSLYFMRIDRAVIQPEGELVVLDANQHLLLRFDEEGRELARRGRPGRGPGEFLQPSLLPATHADSVVVFEFLNLRIQSFAPDLANDRVQLVENDRDGRVRPLGLVGDRWLRLRQMWNDKGPNLEAAMFDEGPVAEVQHYFLYDPASGAERPLSTFDVVRVFQNDTYRDRGPMGHLPSIQVPHFAVPAWVIGSDAVHFTNGRAFDVRSYDSNGRLVRVLRVDARPEPWSEGLVEAWVRNQWRVPQGQAIDPDLLAWHHEAPLPDALPAFRSLVEDSEGWLWARIYGWDPTEPVHWVLFDPEGRARGTVATPPGLEVHSVSVDRLVGIRRSDFGAETLESYRLRRTDP